MDRDHVIQEHVHFSAGELVLEGILEYGSTVRRGRKVLLLSPHPHFAGDMNNNVIRAAAAVLAESGRLVLRFNYHGVEGSEPPPLGGESVFDYWRRVEENRDYGRAVGDALAARAFLGAADGGPPGPCTIVGYSFGALIAALAAPRAAGVAGIVLVAPPFGKIDCAALRDPNCPVLIAAGEKDFVFDRAALEAAAARLGTRVAVETLPDADHFFRKEERALAGRIARFLDELPE